MNRYYARSASDKTDDWPFWFVADKNLGGLNVTADLIRKCWDKNHRGGVLLSKTCAMKLEKQSNEDTK